MGPFTTHRFLTRIALASVHIFSWLFIFQYFFVFSGSLTKSIAAAATSYAFAHVVAILLTPYTAHRLRHGIRGMLVNAMLALSAALAVLAAAFSGVLVSIPLAIALFSLCMGLYRALYWIPYEIAARKSPIGGYLEIGTALIPALAGIYMMSSAVAPIIALSFASGLVLLAIIPLYAMKNTHEGYSWGYRETFQHLFTPAHRMPLAQAICNGFEGAALLFLWPAVVLVLLNWSFALLGIVFSFTILCTMLVRALLDRVHPHVQTPVIHSVLTVTGWLLRGTVAAPIALVLVDTYYQSGSGVVQRGVDLLTSEQTADSNSYVDEFTALKDMGQGIGRVMFCAGVVFFASYLSFPILSLSMFILAGGVAVISIALSRHAVRHAY